LQNKVNSIVTKIEKMPFEAIGEDLKNLLARLDGLLKRIDGETMPEVKKTLEELKRVLVNIDATLVGKDAPTQQQLREALQEITRAAQGVSGLTEYLEKNPEALIEGKHRRNHDEKTCEHLHFLHIRERNCGVRVLCADAFLYAELHFSAGSDAAGELFRFGRSRLGAGRRRQAADRGSDRAE
jgi:hypothetical protein